MKLNNYNEFLVENNQDILKLINKDLLTESLLIREDILLNLDYLLETHIKTCYDDVFHEMLNVYFNNGGSIRKMYMNNGKVIENINEMQFVKFLKNDALNENLIFNQLSEKFNNYYLNKLFETAASPDVPSEDDLGLSGDDYEDTKDEQPSTWAKFKNSVKRAVDYGMMKAKEVTDFIKNGIKQIAEGVTDMIKDGVQEVFKAVEKPVKKIITNIQKVLDKDADKKQAMHAAHKNEHAKDEIQWYKDTWQKGVLDMFDFFAKTVQQGLVKAVKLFQQEDQKEKNENYKFDLDEFNSLYQKSCDTITDIENEVINNLEFKEELYENEHAGDEPISLKSFTNILKDKDKSWYGKFKSLVEELNTLVLHLTKGMIKIFAQLLEKLHGPKAVKQYPVSGATAKLMIEQITPLGQITPNNLGAGKILINVAKSVVSIAAGAFLPPGVKTACTVGLYIAKYMIVLDHFIHETGFGHH